MRSCLVVATLAALVAAGGARAQAPGYDAAWNRPATPHKIVGNIYFVGTTELASFLITTGSGHILIDSGFDETVPLIRTAVERLGFRYQDIRLLLNTQAHFDHAAGLARIKKETGARLEASREDAALLESGGRADFLFGNDRTFPPVAGDRRLADGDAVELGGVRVIARHTPGHTKGGTTFVSIATENGRALQVVFAISTTVNPGTRLVDNPTYPGITADWQRTYAVLESLTGDVWVSQHAPVFNMADKLARLGQRANPYIDPQGFRRHVAASRQRYAAMLSAQVAGRHQP
jgi:metallo-beta-lactamase class B